MNESNQDINRQVKISSLTPRFWKSSGLEIHSVMGLKDRIKHPKHSEEKPLPSKKGRQIVLHARGDISKPDDKNIRICNLMDKDTNTILMKYCEKNTSWNDGGKTRPQNYIHRIGPAEYYYPDGRLAALEMYEENFDIKQKEGHIQDPFLYGPDGNRLDSSDLLDQYGKPCHVGNDITDSKGVTVPPEHYDRLTSIYFDKEGNRISQAEFDVIYMKELDAMGLHAGNTSLSEAEHYEFAPRIKDYNGLMIDLHTEMTKGGDRFTPQDIRELFLADKPESYLKMMSEDILKEHHSYPFWQEMGDDDFIKKQIDMYVYGNFPKAKEYAIQNIENFIEKNNIDTINILETKPVKGMTFNEGLIHTITGNQEGAKYSKIAYQDGPIKAMYFLKNINDENAGIQIDVYDGPYVEFYPDGKLASSINYQYEKGMHPTESYPEDAVFFDKDGRCTNFKTYTHDFKDAWAEYEKNNVSKELAPQDEIQGRNSVELSGMVVSCMITDAKTDGKAKVHLEVCTSSGTDRDENDNTILKNPLYHRVMYVVDKPVPDHITKLQQDAETNIRNWKEGKAAIPSTNFISVKGSLVSNPMGKPLRPYVLAKEIEIIPNAKMKNNIRLEGEIMEAFANPVYATMVVKNNMPNGIDTYIEVILRQQDNKKRYNDIYSGKVKKGDRISVRGMLKSQHLTGGGKEHYICTVATDNFINKSQKQNQKKNRGMGI